MAWPVRPKVVAGLAGLTAWCLCAGYWTCLSVLLSLDCGEVGGRACELIAERVAYAGTTAQVVVWAAAVAVLSRRSRQRRLGAVDWVPAFAVPAAVGVATWLAAGAVV